MRWPARPRSELAETVRRVVGFEGRLRFDPERPDGTPRKLLDTSRLTALGWRPRIGLEDGLKDTYAWFLKHAARDAAGSAGPVFYLAFES